MSFLHEHLAFVLIASGVIFAGIGSTAALFARKHQEHLPTARVVKRKGRKSARRRLAGRRF